MDRAAPLSPIRRRSINLITGLYNRLPRPLSINARALRYIQFQFYLKENTLPLIQKTKYVMMLEEKIAVPCEKHTGKNTLYIQNGGLVGDKRSWYCSYHSVTKEQTTTYISFVITNSLVYWGFWGARFEVLAKVLGHVLRHVVFVLINSYRRFEEAFCLHLQGMAFQRSCYDLQVVAVAFCKISLTRYQ